VLAEPRLRLAIETARVSAWARPIACGHPRTRARSPRPHRGSGRQGRRATADTEPVSIAAGSRGSASHSPERRPLWVGEREGIILGWLSFQSFYGRRPTATAEVSVYV